MPEPTRPDVASVVEVAIAIGQRVVWSLVGVVLFVLEARADEPKEWLLLIFATVAGAPLAALQDAIRKVGRGKDEP